MGFFTLVILAVALGTDAFSLCVGIGLSGACRRQILLISAVILLFHVFMPLAGWFAGGFVGSLVGRAAAVAGSLLLIYLGIRMIWSAWQNKKKEVEPVAVKFNTWGLMLMATSVSIDALSVGFTLGAFQVNLLLTAGIIGIVAGSMAASGLVFGRFLGKWAGGKAQLAGGLVLVGVGVKLFL